MLKLSRASALLVACVCLAPLAGCATGGSKGDTAYVARDVSSLYGAAQRTMQSGDYVRAAKLFDEVERQHPYSVWARHAQVMSAFNYYLAQKYNEAMFTALAVRCAGIFGKQPPPELVARAQFLKQQMDDAERPESYIIETGLDW